MPDPKKRAKDGRPTLRQAIAALLDAVPDDNRAVNRLTVRITAAGDVTYRMHYADGSEAEGGVASA